MALIEWEISLVSVPRTGIRPDCEFPVPERPGAGGDAR
jgi:hypothetical protein